MYGSVASPVNGDQPSGGGSRFVTLTEFALNALAQMQWLRILLAFASAFTIIAHCLNVLLTSLFSLSPLRVLLNFIFIIDAVFETWLEMPSSFIPEVLVDFFAVYLRFLWDPRGRNVELICVGVFLIAMGGISAGLFVIIASASSLLLGQLCVERINWKLGTAAITEEGNAPGPHSEFLLKFDPDPVPVASPDPGYNSDHPDSDLLQDVISRFRALDGQSRGSIPAEQFTTLLAGLQVQLTEAELALTTRMVPLHKTVGLPTAVSFLSSAPCGGSTTGTVRPGLTRFFRYVGSLSGPRQPMPPTESINNV